MPRAPGLERRVWQGLLAPRAVTIAVTSTTGIVHVTDADDAGTIRAQPGQAIEVSLDDRWDWSFQPSSYQAGRPVVARRRPGR